MSAVPKVARPSYASNTLDNVASTSLRMSWESVADGEQEKSADENARAAKQRLAALVITADAVGTPMAQDLTGASRETIAAKDILKMADVLPIRVE